MTQKASRRFAIDALAVAAAFVALALVWGILSTAFQEADDVTHYSFSRWLFRYPAKIVDIWGRPFVTLFYALPAQLGPTVARLSSILLGLVVAWSAARIFRIGGGSRVALPVACTLGMPFVFFQLYGILTELSFAAVLGAGFVLYRARNARGAALAWSLLPLARPEGFFVVPLLAIAVLATPSAHPARPWSLARICCAALLSAGTAVWWLGGLPVYRSVLWMIEEWPKNWRVASVYGDGHPLLFLAFLVLVASPLLFPFTVVGAIRFWRARVRLEIVVIAFVVLLHTVLRTFGLFGSAGYPRYLVTVAPLIGALSGRGVEIVVEHFERRRGALSSRGNSVLAAALAGVLLLCIVSWRYSGPVKGEADAQMIRTIWPWCEKALAANPDLRFVVDHPFFYLHGDVDRTRNGFPFQKDAVEYAEKGDIAIWETKFAGRYSPMKDRIEIMAMGFEPVPTEEVAGPGPYPWDHGEWSDPELANFEFQVLVKKR